MEISKDSILRVSIGTILAFIFFAWTAFGTVTGYTNQIAANTESINAIVKSLELSRIDREIASLRKERRDLKRQVRVDPDNNLIQEQIDELDDAIEDKQAIRECIVKPNQKVCL